MRGGRKEREKGKLPASRGTTTSSWVKTVDSRFVAAAQDKNNSSSSSRRRSKITTKATSGGPTRFAEGLGRGKARDRERQQDTVIGEKDRYDHAKKNTDSWQHYWQRQRALQRMSKQKTTTNKQTQAAGCLVGALPLSLCLSFVCMSVRRIHTHKPNIT